MLEYNPTLYSRILTELTLTFHIIFATIGVGVPLMIALAQWVGIKQNDPHYILLARRWTRGFVITVAVGVVTGTAIGLQLSLLWPKFMEVAGQVIGLPLFMETFAFFFEAIFLGIYIYTFDRFKKPIRHLLLLIPVAIGSTMSAVFITMVNAFMNTPRGFQMKDGIITNIQPLVAMFNPATPTKVAHVLSSAYMTSAFVLAAIAAYQLLRKSNHVYHKKALHLTMISACVFSLATAVIGDLSGKYLAEYQPEKLAAAEWHFETEESAPLILFGVLTEDLEIKKALTIPSALSFLAHGNFNEAVTGLNEFPKDERPPLYIHYLFDVMVLLGMLLMLLSVVYLILYRVRKKRIYKPALLSGIVLSGPLSVLAIEIGWYFTEVGRQPWILRGYMKTSQGATTSEHVDIMIVAFVLLYILLGVVSTMVLRKMFKENPVEKELEEIGIR